MQYLVSVQHGKARHYIVYHGTDMREAEAVAFKKMRHVAENRKRARNKGGYGPKVTIRIWTLFEVIPE